MTERAEAPLTSDLDVLGEDGDDAHVVGVPTTAMEPNRPQMYYILQAIYTIYTILARRRRRKFWVYYIYILYTI